MRRLLLLFWLCAAPLLAVAQDYQAPEVQVSTEKVKIGEKLFLVHKVLPKQTVFSICKAYGITADELKVANPDLKDGLKAGSILYIPATGQALISAPAGKETAPEGEEEMNTGDQPEGPARIIEHKVRLFESVRSIARKYGITPEELLDYNGMSARDVTPGKIVLVPIPRDGEPVDETEEEDPQEPDILDEPEKGSFQPDEPMPPVRKVRWFSASDPLRIALVLPFNATSSKASAQFLNFYCGALMAVQDQKEQGANVVLNVFDLAQGADAILADSKFTGCDLVIGPAEAATMEPFLQFSDEQGIAFVSPLDHKADSLADLHPFFFQVPASQAVQSENLVSSLHAGLNQRVILIQGPASDSLFLQQVETALRRNDITYRKATVSELSGIIGSYGSSINPAKVIIGTENKTVATEAIRSLNALAKKNVHMEVYCTNRVRNYETSDPDALFNIAAHVPAPYFVDYTDSRDQDFVLQYRALFSTEPDDFAFQGYDVLSYFIAAMTRLGTGFCDNADVVPMEFLHCNFQFRRDNEKSGWRNHATRNLVYNRDDFSIAITK